MSYRNMNWLSILPACLVLVIGTAHYVSAKRITLFREEIQDPVNVGLALLMFTMGRSRAPFSPYPGEKAVPTLFINRKQLQQITRK